MGAVSAEAAIASAPPVVGPRLVVKPALVIGSGPALGLAPGIAVALGAAPVRAGASGAVVVPEVGTALVAGLPPPALTGALDLQLTA